MVTKLKLNPLANGIPEPWAVEWGEDAYGVFMGFAVGPIVQRMRYIPPGQFMMGSPETEEERFDDEGPQHEVTLTRGFWLADTPCTQALWLAVMGTNPAQFVGDEKRPVERVSWDDCQTFCKRLNKLTSGLSVRLPTEAEWEYACRAETKGATWLGDDPKVRDKIAWYDTNAKGTTHPVGLKQPNPWGLYDMLGNVWEWCEDWQGKYSEEPAINPVGPQEGSGRVVRGGSWYNQARYVRAAMRYWSGPDDRLNDLGFRLARCHQE